MRKILKKIAGNFSLVVLVIIIVSHESHAATLDTKINIVGGGKCYIWIEAEKADKIEPSFDILNDKNCSGGKYHV
jgi:hypothetical protein